MCPPATELCDLDTRLWPTLSSIDPAFGPAAGGITLTLFGDNLDALEPPVILSFGTVEGTETAATDLVIFNATHATATIPSLLGATRQVTRAESHVAAPNPSCVGPPLPLARLCLRASACAHPLLLVPH